MPAEGAFGSGHGLIIRLADAITEARRDAEESDQRAERAEAQVEALREAMQWARQDSRQLVGMEDPFGSQGPPMLVGANAYFAFVDALEALASLPVKLRPPLPARQDLTPEPDPAHPRNLEPTRNRVEAAGVDGLTALEEEDAPSS